MRGFPRQFWTAAVVLALMLEWPQIGQSRGTGIPIDMPISLAVGRVKSPGFKVKNGAYGIMIRVKRRLSLDVIDCMLGIKFSSDEPDCGKEPALQANWTLWSDGQIVKRGSTSEQRNGGGWAYESVERVIGAFNGVKGKEYILEVTFTKDGTALDITEPHLVVQLSND